MKLEKVNSESKKEQIKFYQGRSLQELQRIRPKWACGEYADHVLDFNLHPKNNEYSIFLVDTSELIKNAELYEVNPKILFTGDMLNDGRIASLLRHWSNNGFVDPPTVDICQQYKNKLSFSDGRHRAKLNYLLGYKQVPIAIHNSQIKAVSEILNLDTGYASAVPPAK